MTADGSLTEVGWAVLIAAAVLVSGVLLRAAGRWLARSVGRDFHAQVRTAAAPELDEIKAGIAAMRAEQLEQHSEVRTEVQRLGMRMDLVDQRLDRIEQRTFPTVTQGD
jgi:hypothetical protein